MYFVPQQLSLSNKVSWRLFCGLIRECGCARGAGSCWLWHQKSLQPFCPRRNGQREQQRCAQSRETPSAWCLAVADEGEGFPSSVLCSDLLLHWLVQSWRSLRNCVQLRAEAAKPESEGQLVLAGNPTRTTPGDPGRKQRKLVTLTQSP